MDMNQIMKKIGDLQNLADRPGTPEEAAAALMQIQKLMAKYRISQEELRPLASRRSRRPTGAKSSETGHREPLGSTSSDENRVSRRPSLCTSTS